jgi:flagellar biosynthetic protein FlhB
MADDSHDDSQKTEEPTPKRLEEARRKGQVPSSREVNHWFVLLAGTIVVMAMLPAAGRDLVGMLRRFLEQPQAIPADFANLQAVIGETMSGLGLVMLPVFLLLVVAALAACLLQSGVVFAPDQIRPQLERISILSGAKRLFSLRALTEFAKGIAKLAIVGSVAFYLMWPAMPGLEQLPAMAVQDSTAVMWRLATKLMIGVLSIVTIIAGVDFLYQKLQFLRQMRMSRQEIRDELKQSEGDPAVRNRLRQIRRERAQRRMMQAVRQASVVVTNPTHYAVALKYELETMQAPVVVAKGIDHLALKIREIAEEADVPVMQSPPLARALYAGVEIDEEIPVEHYKAVAEIIGYVMRLKGKLPPRRRPAPAPPHQAARQSSN